MIYISLIRSCVDLYLCYWLFSFLSLSKCERHYCSKSLPLERYCRGSKVMEDSIHILFLFFISLKVSRLFIRLVSLNLCVQVDCHLSALSSVRTRSALHNLPHVYLIHIHLSIMQFCIDFGRSQVTWTPHRRRTVKEMCTLSLSAKDITQVHALRTLFFVFNCHIAMVSFSRLLTKKALSFDQRDHSDLYILQVQCVCLFTTL